MSCVLGLDLAPTLNGFAVGDGSSAPLAGAWALPDCGPRLGQLARAHKAELAALFRTHEIGAVCYESPILGRYDKLWTIRRIYGLGMITEDFVKDWNEKTAAHVTCREVDLRTVKKQLSGAHDASKADMVYHARRLGIELPATDVAGRKDAADAVGVWLCGLKDHAPAAHAQWDAKLWLGRGRMI